MTIFGSRKKLRGALPIVAASGQPAEGGDVEVAARIARRRIAIVPPEQSTSPLILGRVPRVAAGEVEVVGRRRRRARPVAADDRGVARRAASRRARPRVSQLSHILLPSGNVPGVVDDEVVQLRRFVRRDVPGIPGPIRNVGRRIAVRSQADGLRERIGDRELQAVDVAAVQLHLQRVVGRRPEVRANGDVLVARVRPQEFVRLRRARRLRILVLRVNVEESRLVRDDVDVASTSPRAASAIRRRSRRAPCPIRSRAGCLPSSCSSPASWRLARRRTRARAVRERAPAAPDASSVSIVP